MPYLGYFLTLAKARKKGVLDSLKIPIAELNLSERAQHCLMNNGIETVWQLAEKIPGRMVGIRGGGQWLRGETERALKKRRLEHGIHMTSDLKRELNIPLNGDEPSDAEVRESIREARRREEKRVLQLPPLEDLKKARDLLDRLINDYPNASQADISQAHFTVKYLLW